MNCRQCSYPARVSGVRDRGHGNRMALPAPHMRIAAADWAVVLDDLRSPGRDTHDDHRGLVFLAVHDRLLDVVSCIRRRVARVDGATAVCAMVG
jgi:hypothetical protein